MNKTDEIIYEIQLGCKEKYAEIIDIFQKPLYRYILYHLRDSHEAEDVLQEVFIKTYDKIKNYKLNDCFSAWIYRIAHNATINIIKKRNRMKVFSAFNFDFKKQLEQIPDNDSGIFSSDEEFYAALSMLSQNEKSLIYLRVFEEKSYEEICCIIGKKPSTLRKQFERAKNKLKKYYEEIGRKPYEGIYIRTEN